MWSDSKKWVFIFFIALVNNICVFSQSSSCTDDFVFLQGASVIGPEKYYDIVDLQYAVDSLKRVVGEISGVHSDILSPKIFDVGFYTLNPLYEGGVAEAIDRAKEMAYDCHPSHLLFMRESSQHHNNHTLHFYANLPEEGYCYSNSRLMELVDNVIGVRDLSEEYSVFELEAELILLIANHLHVQYICCTLETNISSDKQNKKFDLTCSEEVIDELEERSTNVHLNVLLGFFKCVNLPVTVSPDQFGYVYRAILSLKNRAVSCYYYDIGIKIHLQGFPNVSSIQIVSPNQPEMVELPCGRETSVKVNYYDFGALTIGLVGDLYTYIDSLYSAEDIKSLLSKVKNSTSAKLTNSEVHILASYLSCEFDALEVSTQLDFIEVILRTYPYNNYLKESIQNMFTEGSLPSILQYMLSFIPGSVLYDAIKCEPNYGDLLVDYDIYGDYSMDLKLILAQKYREAYNNNKELYVNQLIENGLAIPLPLEINDYYFFFNKSNFDITHDTVAKKIVVTELTRSNDMFSNEVCDDGVHFISIEGDYDNTYDYTSPVLIHTLSGDITRDEDVAGKPYLVPAFMLPWITQQIRNDNIGEAISLFVDVASITIGGAGLYRAIAKGAWKVSRVKFASDVVSTAAGLANLGVKALPDCDQACKEIGTVLLLIELSSGSISAYKSLRTSRYRSLESAIKKLNKTDAQYFDRVRSLHALEYTDDYLRHRISALLSTESKFSQDIKSGCIENVKILSNVPDEVLRSIDEVYTDFNQLPALITDISRAAENSVDLIGFFVKKSNAVNAWDIMFSKQTFRTDVTLLQRMSDDIVLEPAFETFIRNNPSKLDGWKVWKGTYNSLGDPAKNVLGSGRINNTAEWNQLISEAEAAGVEVIFRPGSIAYSPGLKKGQPGQLIIDQDASITALRHEHRHFIDDHAEGFKGYEGIFDPNFRVTTEYNAYKLEVEEMLNLGETSIANQLKNNFQAEVNDIMSKMGTPNQSVLDLIDDLMGL